MILKHIEVPDQRPDRAGGREVVENEKGEQVCSFEAERWRTACRHLGRGKWNEWVLGPMEAEASSPGAKMTHERFLWAPREKTGSLEKTVMLGITEGGREEEDQTGGDGRTPSKRPWA